MHNPTLFKITMIFYLALLLAGCANSSREPIDKAKTPDAVTHERFFSRAVGDSFSLFVQLPGEYSSRQGHKYPVVFLPDANLHFDVLAAVLKKYSEVGMLPPAILVGIGYSDFETMDALRSRDLTYPVALPEYEVEVSGKADRFMAFLCTELIPHIEKKHAADSGNRILMGHSLGGYFALYALSQQQQSADQSTFSGFIAASPSVHYNHNYILDILERASRLATDKSNVYVNFGGSEDEEEDDTTVISSVAALARLEATLKQGNYRGVIHSGLGHMDTPVPAFVQGLQWMLASQE